MTRWLLVLVLVGACGGKKEDKGPPPAPPSAPAPAPGSAAVVEPAPTATPAAEKATAFWRWFSAHAADLGKEPNMQATMETISAELEKLYPGVFAEIGKNGDELTLVLSVDGNKKLFPQVQELYAARPTVPRWKVVAFRQRDADFAVEMNGTKIEPKSVKFVGEPAQGKLDITVYLPGYKQGDENLGKIGFILLDHTIGEYDMETKTAGIDFAALDTAPAKAKPLTDLPAMVDAIK